MEFAVKTYLEHKELWKYVDPMKTVTDSKNDVKAKSEIILLVDPISYIMVTARQVWINFQNAFEDSGLSRRVGLLKD